MQSLVDMQSLVNVLSLVDAQSSLLTSGIVVSCCRVPVSLSLVNPLSCGVQEPYNDWLLKSPLSTRSLLLTRSLFSTRAPSHFLPLVNPISCGVRELYKE